MSLNSFVPVASPTKFATVLGASFVNNSHVMLPSEVLIIAVSACADMIPTVNTKLLSKQIIFFI